MLSQVAGPVLNRPIKNTMLYRLALVLLAPVLFIQGRYVRWATLRLAEAQGPRMGQAGEGEPLRLLIVGDSAAAGVGVGQQQRALSGCLAAQLSPRCELHWQVLARTGDRAEDLLEHLLAQAPQSHDVAVVSIGVNDVTGMTRARQWQEHLRLIRQELVDRFGVSRIYFCGLPPMHLFPALPQPLRWWLGLRARQLSALMQQLSDEDPVSCYFEVPYSDQIEDAAIDGFHPGPLAYRRWAAHLARQISDCAAFTRT